MQAGLWRPPVCCRPCRQDVYKRQGVDHYFQRNAAIAEEEEFHFGFYLYVTARTEAEAREEAAFFADLIQGKRYDCRPAMDFEKFSGLSREQINSIGLAFLQELERLTGVKPMLYTDAYAANEVWQESLGDYPLWVAEYGPESPEVTSGHWTCLLYTSSSVQLTTTYKDSEWQDKLPALHGSVYQQWDQAPSLIE